MSWEETGGRKVSRKALKVRISLPVRKRAAAAAKSKKQRIVWTSSDDDEDDDDEDDDEEDEEHEEAVDYSMSGTVPVTQREGRQGALKEDEESQAQPSEKSPPTVEGVAIDDVGDIERHLKEQKLKKQAIERSIRNIKKQSRINSKKRRQLRGGRRKIYVDDSDSDYEPDQIKQTVVERRESSRRSKAASSDFVTVVDVGEVDPSEVCTAVCVQSPTALLPPPESPDEVIIDTEKVDEVEVFACTLCQTFFIEESKLAEHIMDAHVRKVKIKIESDDWLRMQNRV